MFIEKPGNSIFFILHPSSMGRHLNLNIRYTLFGLTTMFSLGCQEQADPDKIIEMYNAPHMNRGLVHIVKKFGEDRRGAGEEVPPHVFEIGHTEDFIIAKQHPTNGFGGGYIEDTTVTNFYIIDMKNKFQNYLEMKIGPLTQNEFDSLRSVFKIQDMEFDRKFPVRH